MDEEKEVQAEDSIDILCKVLREMKLEILSLRNDVDKLIENNGGK